VSLLTAMSFPSTRRPARDSAMTCRPTYLLPLAWNMRRSIPQVYLRGRRGSTLAAGITDAAAKNAIASLAAKVNALETIIHNLGLSA
jgi:hypothetical protein